MPNYFGYQRFGKDVVDNLAKAKDVVYGEELVKDKKLSKMLVAAYQSSFFNGWLTQFLDFKFDDGHDHANWCDCNGGCSRCGGLIWRFHMVINVLILAW